jgi:hypothetical protein
MFDSVVDIEDGGHVTCLANVAALEIGNIFVIGFRAAVIIITATER